MNKVFVTGASGFIGQSVCRALASLKYSVCGAIRHKNSLSNVIDIDYAVTGDITSKVNWKDLLAGYNCVIHCAGKAHITNNSENNSLETYRLINLESTKFLADQCNAAGVKRLIFLSSIGVLGADTNNRKPFLYSDNPNPIDNYAISKYEAEKALFQISRNTGLEIVIIRAPLVYGSDAPGNLSRLIKLISYGVPLPFGAINNKRSFIGIDNLVDALVRCIDHPEVAGKIFLVSDDEDLSTPELIKRMRVAMQRSLNLFPVPILFLKFFSSLMGFQKEMNKLTDSLQVDISYTKKILNWSPVLTVQEGITKMIRE